MTDQPPHDDFGKTPPPPPPPPPQGGSGTPPNQYGAPGNYGAQGQYGPPGQQQYQVPPPAKKSGMGTGVIVLLLVGGLLVGGCCIVMVLASIAVPNFLEAQVRSKVSRVKADQRAMAVAIEAFYIDNGTYPASTNQLNASVQPSWMYAGPEFSSIAAGSSLTTPLAYMMSYVPDPFADDPNITFMYYSTGKWWMLWSPGPDTDYDIMPPVQQWTMGREGIPTQILNWTYDPTNGTVSDGDIWRVRQ